MSVIDLPDGRVIGCSVDEARGEGHWVACRVETVENDSHLIKQVRLADAPADVPVYGTSLAFLLDAAMDSGGDIAHLETGRLADLPD